MGITKPRDRPAVTFHHSRSRSNCLNLFIRTGGLTHSPNELILGSPRLTNTTNLYRTAAILAVLLSTPIRIDRARWQPCQALLNIIPHRTTTVTLRRVRFASSHISPSLPELPHKAGWFLNATTSELCQ